MAKKVDTFDDCWRRYVNGGYGDESSLLLAAALKVASTFEETCQVLSAAMSETGVDYDTRVGYVRARSLKKAIELVSNEAEARRVYSLASKKMRDGKFFFPAREKEAKAKLESFSKLVA